jgi:hypothetical protein
MRPYSFRTEDATPARPAVATMPLLTLHSMASSMKMAHVNAARMCDRPWPRPQGTRHLGSMVESA